VSQYDAIVIGGGPGGSVFASRLAALGRRVVILERGHHPRFHLGESLLPCSMPVLDAIGVLDEVRSTFMLKKAARFVAGTGGADAMATRYPFSDAFHARSDYAFQVPRDKFDELLWRRAGACGAELRDGCEVTRVVFEGTRAVGVEARSEDGMHHALTASVIVDASGREALVARAAQAVERIAHLDRTALFTQVRGAWRDTGEREGDIQIVVFGEGAERGWFWLIPFRDGRTSVGAVVSNAWIRARQNSGGAEALFHKAVDEAPTVGWMIGGAETVLPPGSTADFSFRVASLRGDGWIAVGDAGGFIDPLFSTGAHLAMHGGLVGANTVHAAFDAGDVTADRLEAYEREMRAGSELYVGAVQGFYAGELVQYLFAEPQHPFLRRAITSMLAGDVFEDARWIKEMRTRFPPLK
jgi:flavin-dependent dehydrogenase